MKRVFDVSVAMILLLVLLPVFVVAAAGVMIFMGWPILFVHRRPGLGSKPFCLVKFRTMRELRSADENLLPDAERLTAFGRFLRSSSLDELPELWNVLKGDMSLVGPRPLEMEYLPLYSREQARRHEVRPGITGLAQVSGRNALSWSARFSYDVWYVDNQSMILDLKILLRTAKEVIFRNGVVAEGNSKVESFDGTN